MADGVTITSGANSTPPDGTVVSTDDAGASGHVQRVKLTYSADGSATHIPADADGLLVNLGTNNDVTIADGGGSITVDGTVSISGTVTVDASGVAVPVTDNGGSLTVDGSVTIADGGNVISIDDAGGSLTVDGTVAVSAVGGTVTVSGTVDTELTTADLDTGAGTDTRAVVGLVGSKSGGAQLIPGDATAGLKVDLGADNDVTVTSGSITANAGTNLNTSALALDATLSSTNTLVGAVNETAPATDTANSGLNGRLQRIAQRLTSLIALLPSSIGQKNTAGSLSVTLSSDHGNVPENIAQVNGQTVNVGTGAAGTGTLRVTTSTDSTIATVTAVTAITNALPAGTNAIGKLAANSGVDIGDVDITSTVLPPGAASSSVTSVNDTNVSTTLLSATAGRKGFRIVNDSTAILYVKYGTTASTTSYTVQMAAGAYLEENFYAGRVDGIWASDASGAARITELT